MNTPELSSKPLHLTLLCNNGARFDMDWVWTSQIPNMEMLKKVIKANDGFLTDVCFISAMAIFAIFIEGSGNLGVSNIAGPTAPGTDTKQ
jgi:hypothetical protein